MIRAIVAFSLALTLTGLGFAADDPRNEPDEPPVLLKKKKPDPPREVDEKPKLEEKDKKKPKLEEPKEEPPEATEPATDPKEILERIAKNVRESEQRLREKKYAGDGTRQVQRDIVKDIDALIERSEQPPPPSGGGESNPDPKSGSGQQQQAPGSSRPKGSRSKRGNGPPKSGDPKDQGGDGNQGGAGKGSPGDKNEKPDIFNKEGGLALPELDRRELDSYLREEFGAKYADLLKQYYQTIAEKGRRTEKK